MIWINGTSGKLLSSFTQHLDTHNERAKIECMDREESIELQYLIKVLD